MDERGGVLVGAGDAGVSPGRGRGGGKTADFGQTAGWGGRPSRGPSRPGGAVAVSQGAGGGADGVGEEFAE